MKIEEHSSPPKWADRFLSWYCSDKLIDEIQGDLHEAYYYNCIRLGSKKANWRFIKGVLSFCKPSSFKKNKRYLNSTDMYKNYYKATYRNFINHKVYSLINLSGLIVGIASCLLITLYLIEEFSYDKFHPKPQNTYRVVMDMYNNGELSAKSAPIYPAVGPNLVNEFPEIIDYVRILPFGNGVYSVKKPNGTLVRFNEENAVLADENFFKVFGFRLLKGNPDKVLSEKDQIVLSTSAASRYFGNEDPIGKTILFRGSNSAVITGVMEDFPENSHMNFDVITSLKSLDGFDEWESNWGWYDFYTFIQTNDQTDILQLTEKLQPYLHSKKSEDHASTGSLEVLWPQNIQDIHLYSKDMSWEMGENGGAQQIYFLTIIALLILVTAWVNYINLATASAVKRANEVGVRKVIGARKWDLISQFLTESFLYNSFSVLLSILFVILLTPIINQLLDVALNVDYLFSAEILFGLLGLVFIGTFVSGLYPAFVLTSFKPLNVLKGNFYNRKAKFGFRQILVVLQFTVSAILILGTILVVKQLNFMQSKDLGLNVKQTLVIKAPSSSTGNGDLENRKNIFVNRLNQLTDIKGFTASNVVPGVENFSISGFNTKADLKLTRDCYEVSIDEKYFTEFDIDLLAGRNFNKNFASDSVAVIINQEAVNLFGFGSPESAIGKVLNPNNRYQLKIIGVTENYHHSSLKESLDPIVFYYRPQSGNYYSIKLTSADFMSSINTIENVWDEIYPDNPFDFFFLDEFFDRQYKSDHLFNSIFVGFAGLAIFVACLGLFGLVSFTAEQAKKEIGIRKVLGASVSKILVLLIKDYLILILFAFLIAFPLGYYMMHNWLQEFAYRTTIEVSIFFGAGFAILLIAFLTVCFKSITVARTNPIDALRNE